MHPNLAMELGEIELPREIANTNIFGFQFVFLQPFPSSEIRIIDLFLEALLSFVCLVLTSSSSLVI